MTIYYKSGSNTEYTLTGTVESASPVTAKNGSKCTRIMVKSNQTYQAGGEVKSIAQNVIVWYPYEIAIEPGTAISVQGKLGLTVGIPKGPNNKYETSQILIKDPQVAVFGTPAKPFEGINSAAIIGYVGKVREINGQTPGFAVSVCVSHSVKSGNEWKSEKEWFDCTIWGKRSEQAKKMIAKGDTVMFTGRLNMRQVKSGEVQKLLLAFNAMDFNVLHHEEPQEQQSGTPMESADASFASSGSDDFAPSPDDPF